MVPAMKVMKAEWFESLRLGSLLWSQGPLWWSSEMKSLVPDLTRL